jgi:hypothetical protein
VIVTALASLRPELSEELIGGLKCFSVVLIELTHEAYFKDKDIGIHRDTRRPF